MQNRVDRKVIQVENMLSIALRLRSAVMGVTAVHVVEFCSGSGYIGLPLASLCPNTRVTLIDMNVREVSFLSSDVLTRSMASFSASCHRYRPGAHQERRAARPGVRAGHADRADARAVPAGPGASRLRGRDRYLLAKVKRTHAAIRKTIALAPLDGLSIARCVSSRAAFAVCSCCIGKILSQRKGPLSGHYQRTLDEVTHMISPNGPPHHLCLHPAREASAIL